MKKVFVMASMAILLFSFGTSFAKGVGVGVINLTTILQKDPAAQKVIKKLNKSLTAKNVALNKRLGFLRSDVKKFQNMPTVKASSRDKLRKRINIEAKDLRADRITMQQKFYKQRNKSIVKVLDRVKAAAAKVAKKQGLVLVIDNANVAYVADSIDITNLVLKTMK